MHVLYATCDMVAGLTFLVRDDHEVRKLRLKIIFSERLGGTQNKMRAGEGKR